ncbi:putative mitochondrial protein [Artemisia annua]|uniref:Putative mitochondrial protein n=1 Tax=Artemisia annua TaxID=35608 RepID=A0A2U1L107_ARTAN|nr:putative mitochondrial protein [Artemisia annua]
MKKVEKQFQSSDSSEAVPQHEVNETTESQAPMTRTLNHERKRPVWHTDYVMEGNARVNPGSCSVNAVHDASAFGFIAGKTYKSTQT